MNLLKSSAFAGLLLSVTAGAIAQNKSNGEPYYGETKGYPLFNPYPNNTGRGGNRPWLVRNFGPVGIGINLVRPGMTMQIHNIEEGSPAAATGKLKKGQIIESINGTVLKEIDPRIILGDLITEAEAKDGKVVLKIKGEGAVTVQIPVMGSYSETWPLNCKKSDKIVRQMVDLLAKEEKPQSLDPGKQTFERWTCSPRRRSRSGDQ